jgi:hypothetical protein
MRQYLYELKLESMRLYYEEGKTRAEVTKLLGIGNPMQWKIGENCIIRKMSVDQEGVLFCVSPTGCGSTRRGSFYTLGIIAHRRWGWKVGNAQLHSSHKVHLIRSPCIHHKQLIPLLSSSSQQMSRILRTTAQSNLDCIHTRLHHEWELTGDSLL